MSKLSSSNYKSMSYEQLSIEAKRLIEQGWFKNFDIIQIIHREMKIKYHLEINCV